MITTTTTTTNTAQYYFFFIESPGKYDLLLPNYVRKFRQATNA